METYAKAAPVVMGMRVGMVSTGNRRCMCLCAFAVPQQSMATCCAWPSEPFHSDGLRGLGHTDEYQLLRFRGLEFALTDHDNL